jgi:hypothetical protein
MGPASNAGPEYLVVVVLDFPGRLSLSKRECLTSSGPANMENKQGSLANMKYKSVDFKQKLDDSGDSITGISVFGGGPGGLTQTGRQINNTAYFAPDGVE